MASLGLTATPIVDHRTRVRAAHPDLIEGSLPDEIDPNFRGAPCEAPRSTDADSGEFALGVVAEPTGVAPLCARIARGDREAFAEFYGLWFDRAFAMARSLTRRDESFCLDVVQETMLRVARRIPAIDKDTAVSRWMIRSVHSSAIDLLRRESRSRRRDRAVSRAEASDARNAAMDAHLSEWLRRAIAGLNEQDREALTLRFGHGASLEDVGRAAGTTADAAHGRLRRVLARLRGAGP